jgi:RNA polymerase sigma factor (sigma-70 family)
MGDSDLGMEAVAVRPSPAIDELLIEHSGALLAAARIITLNEAEAQDLVQVTFEIALRRSHTLREPGSLRAWLLAIEAREAVRRVRAMRRLVPFGIHLRDMADPEPAHDQTVALREGLRVLPRRVRAAIALHYLAGYSVRETAAVLGVSEKHDQNAAQEGPGPAARGTQR